MKRRTISFYAVTMAFTALLMISAIQELYSDDVHMSAQCSNGTLNGTYGFYSTGNTADGPLARVGLVKFDGNGNWTLKQHTSRNGKFEASTFSGRTQVAADCTLKVFTEDDHLLNYGVVVDDGNGV